MNSAELIEMIKAVDPLGEMDVCLSNVGVTDVYVAPANENGWYQVVSKIKNGRPQAKYVGTGTKLVLCSTSIYEMFKNYPTVDVDIVGIDDHGFRRQMVDDWRGYRLKNNEVASISAPVAVFNNGPQNDEDDENDDDDGYDEDFDVEDDDEDF